MTNLISNCGICGVEFQKSRYSTKRFCSVECGRKSYTLKRYGVMSAKDRLEKYSIPEPMSGCVLWTGKISRNGYGFLGGTLDMMAHRVAYKEYRGPIPNGHQIDHLCRVRSCVNPYHLEAVTLQENLRRGHAAMNGLCKRGHSKEGKNKLLLFSKKAGKYHTVCVECRAIAKKNYLNREREKRVFVCR